MYDAPERMNDLATCTPADTRLTQPKSGFVLEDTRRDLIAQRELCGADTPAGHRLSNLIGQITFLPAAFGDQRKNLLAGIARQMADLAAMNAENN